MSHFPNIEVKNLLSKKDSGQMVIRLCLTFLATMTVFLSFTQNPIGNADQFCTNFNVTDTFDVLLNDIDTGGQNLTITSVTLISPTDGFASNVGGEFISFNPPDTFAGDAFISYSIVNDSGQAATGILARILVIRNADAGLNDTVCSTNYVLSGNVPAGAVSSGLWSVLQGSATINNPSNFNSTVSNLSPIVNSFIWKHTANTGGCFSSDTVHIIRDTIISANAGMDSAVCGTAYNLSANSPGVGVGLWKLINGMGVLSDSSNNTTLVSNLGIDNNEFAWQITNGKCISKDTVTIRRDTIISSFAGLDDTTCDEMYILSGNTPTPGTGEWYIISGTGQLFNSLNPNAIVADMLPGNREVKWVVTNGVCVSRDSVNIFRDAVVADAGPDDTICDISNYTLAGNNPNPKNGEWKVLIGAGSFVDSSMHNTIINGLTAGENILTWSIFNDTCVSVDTVIIIRDTTIQADAGEDITICNIDKILDGNNPSPGTGLWSLKSGSGDFEDSTDPNTQASNLQLGANEFIWTITNIICVHTDTVEIQRTNSISVDAGEDDTICSNVYILKGNNTAAGSGLWTVVSGSGVFADSSDSNSVVTGLAPGLNVFRWKITLDTCGAADLVSIYRDTIIFANAGLDDTICDSNYLLGANDPNPGVGIWRFLSGSGIFSDSSDYNSSITNLLPGLNELEWSITNGICNHKDSINILRYELITAFAGMNDTICDSVYTLAGNVPTQGTGMWNSLTGGVTFNNPLQANTVVNLIPGANILVWTITNGICISKDTVEIFRYQYIPAVVGVNDTICDINYILNASDPFPGMGVWRTIAGAGSFADSNNFNTTVSGINTGLNAYSWTIKNGLCPVNSDTINIFRYLYVSANAGMDDTICSTSYTLSGSNNDPGIGAWVTLLGTGSVVGFSDSATTVNNLSAGSNLLSWTITNGVCISKDTIELFRYEYIQADAGTIDTTCDTSYQLIANNPFPGSGHWSLLIGTGIFQDSNSSMTLLNGIGEGMNSIMWTIENGNCPLSTDTVDIFRYLLVEANVGVDDTLCDNFYTLSGNNPFPGTGQWMSIIGAGIFSDSSDSNAVVNGLSSGINLLSWTISNGICIDADTIVLLYNQAPIALNDSITIIEEDSFNINVISNDTDPESDSLILSFVSNPINGTALILANDSFFYKRNSGFLGQDSFLYSICDACLKCDTAKVIITIQERNRKPIAVNDTLVIEEDSFLVFSPLANDFDSNTIDILSVLIVDNPVHGNVVVNNNLLTYSPDPDFFGFDSIIYAACDDAFPSLCDTATVLLSILPVNDAPIAIDDQFVTKYLTPLNLDVLLNDTDIENDSLFISEILSFDDGTIVENNKINFSPKEGFSGVKLITYVVCDDGVTSKCDTADVLVTVNVDFTIIPNVITPNQDGYNDYFVVVGLEEYLTAELDIYDEWGNLIFSSPNYINDWNGKNNESKEVPKGTYFYKLVLTGKQKVEKRSGYIVLIR